MDLLRKAGVEGDIDFLKQPAQTVTQILIECEANGVVGAKPSYSAVPIRPESVGSYIEHQLSVAGMKHPLFSDDAARLIHQYSKGIPRQINNLCTAALLAGFAEQRRVIDESTVKQALMEFQDAVSDWLRRLPSGDTEHEQFGDNERERQHYPACRMAYVHPVVGLVQLGGVVRKPDPLPVNRARVPSVAGTRDLCRVNQS